MARRDLRRHPHRSALIVALVALPVAGLTAGTVLLRAATITGQQRATAVMGAATLRADAASPMVTLDPAPLPPGSRVVSFAATGGLLRVGPGDVRPVSLTDQPLDDPLTAGMLRLHAGRAPSGPAEVAVSTQVLRELGRRIGDPMRLVRPARSLRITGTVVNPADVHARLAVTSRGVLGASARRAWLIALPQGVADPGVLNGVDGLAVTTRERAAAAPVGRRGTGALNLLPVIAGLALMVAALVAAAAFAAGVRRETRELGLLAAAASGPAPGVLAVALGCALAGVGALPRVVNASSGLASAWPWPG